MGCVDADVSPVPRGEVGAHAAWRSGARFIALPACKEVWDMVLGVPKGALPYQLLILPTTKG